MKILIADDKPSNRQFLSFVLEDEGYVCVHAENGLEAIKKYQEDLAISIILMDVNMPEMDGIAATKKVCELKKNDRYISIIFVTVLDNAEALSLCLDAGGDDFIPKPVNESVLLAKVKAHFRMHDTYNRLLRAHEELKFHQQVMDREHAIVEHVFANGVNRAETYCENVTVRMESMSSFNGDIVLSAPSPSGGVYVLVGDFTGHGLTAAIGSLPVMSVFFKGTQNQCSVSELAREFNAYLHDVLPTGMFFCANILHLNQEGNRVSVWSGGINDMLFIPDSASELISIPGMHMPLGILPEDQFEDMMDVHDLDHPGCLYVYTDGVIEAKDETGTEFGENRLKEVLRSSPVERVDAVMAAVKAYQSNSQQDDDISIAEIRCVPCVHRSKKTDRVVNVFRDTYAIGCFPWTVNFTLKGEDLKRIDAAKQIVSLLVTIEGVALHHDKIFTIVSELYNNALDHGVLGLKSELKCSPKGFDEYYALRKAGLNTIDPNAYIDVNIEYLRGDPNRVKIKLSDSGAGFDHTALRMDLNENDDSFGRGLHLLNSLCSELSFSDGGRTVTAYYNVVLENA